MSKFAFSELPILRWGSTAIKNYRYWLYSLGWVVGKKILKVNPNCQTRHKPNASAKKICLYELYQNQSKQKLAKQCCGSGSSTKLSIQSPNPIWCLTCEKSASRTELSCSSCLLVAPFIWPLADGSEGGRPLPAAAAQEVEPLGCAEPWTDPKGHVRQEAR